MPVAAALVAVPLVAPAASGPCRRRAAAAPAAAAALVLQAVLETEAAEAADRRPEIEPAAVPAVPVGGEDLMLSSNSEAAAVEIPQEGAVAEPAAAAQAEAEVVSVRPVPAPADASSPAGR